jgi:hypothetical protein
MCARSSSSPGCPEVGRFDYGRSRRVKGLLDGYAAVMKLVRGAAALGAAKMVYDQARKPENQAKLKSAVARAKASRKSRRR